MRDVIYHVKVTALDVTGSSSLPDGWPGDRLAMCQGIGKTPVFALAAALGRLEKVAADQGSTCEEDEE